MTPLLRFFQSVGGQLLVLLLIAVLVTQGLGYLLFSDERNRAVRSAMGLEAAGRAANVALLLDEAPASLRGAILRSANSPLVRFQLSDTPDAKAENSTAAEILAQVHGILGGPEERKIYGEVTPISGPRDRRMPQMPAAMRPMHMAMMAQRTEPFQLVLSINLVDGRWLNVQSMFHRPKAQWSRTSLYSVLLMIAAIMLVVWVMGRRIVAPMNALANGAERLGRGIETEALPVSGPREIRDTVAAFNRMQSRLTRFVNNRTQLLAALGHDLRSPLTAMRLRIELLDETEDSIRLKAMVDEMQTMVEATLEFARGVAQSEPAVEIDLADLLSELVEDTKVAGADASLDVQMPVLLQVHPVALKRAFRNLIDNAIRYAGNVEVRLGKLDNMAEIRIADNGPGVPEDQLLRMFEPFVRLETSRNRTTGGSGLGLAIARTIIQSHGGEITLSNRASGGLMAIVNIPLFTP